MKPEFGSFVSGSVRIPYGRIGEGKKHLVILPGVSLSPVSPFVSEVAGRFGEGFLTNRTVWLMDRPEVIPEGYTVRNRAEDVAKALLSEGVTAADIYGASAGGMEGVCLAADHPEMAEHLVIASSGLRVEKPAREIFENWKKLALEKDSRGVTEAFLNQVYGEESLRKIRKESPLEAPSYPEKDLLNFVRCIDAIMDIDLKELSGRIRCPVLVVGSKGDRVFGPQPSEEIARITGGSLFLYGAEYGHAVYDEAGDFFGRMETFFLK